MGRNYSKCELLSSHHITTFKRAVEREWKKALNIEIKNLRPYLRK